jgi:hypothetical protein
MLESRIVRNWRPWAALLKALPLASFNAWSRSDCWSIRTVLAGGLERIQA